MVESPEMKAADPFERLAAALDALPNRFPRTPGGKEIRILQKIFSSEEAALVGLLTGRMELPATIAERAGLPVDEVAARLKALAKRGMVWLEMDRQARSWRFRLAPFVVGIFEESLPIMDHELAHLIEDYMWEGGAEGIMRPDPALHRVVPARSALPTEWVLPYEDVVQILDRARTFAVRECVCRTQREGVGRRCDFPTHNCLTFSNLERSPKAGDISRAEALALLDRSEEVGLVHTVSNVVEGLYYVCNCCGCCCAVLRGVNQWGIENSVAKATYLAEIDSEICTDCGVCTRRCQVHAVAEVDGATVVDPVRCIGCGLCVSGCTSGAASLRRRPGWEAFRPPETFAEWEQRRQASRPPTPGR